MKEDTKLYFYVCFCYFLYDKCYKIKVEICPN